MKKLRTFQASSAWNSYSHKNRDGTKGSGGGWNTAATVKSGKPFWSNYFTPPYWQANTIGSRCRCQEKKEGKCTFFNSFVLKLNQPVRKEEDCVFWAETRSRDCATHNSHTSQLELGWLFILYVYIFFFSFFFAFCCLHCLIKNEAVVAAAAAVAFATRTTMMTTTAAAAQLQHQQQ